MTTKVLDRWVLGDRIGRGATSSVYRAHDEAGQVVAVKLLDSLDPLARRRFAREATLLAELRHPHVVEYVAHGDGDPPCLVMEWLEGESLQTALARGRLDVDEGVALFRALASALGAAHERGVVHRDVKPGNVFLVGGDPRRPKLLDFGIARAEAFDRLTRAGMFVGTPAYVSPEQARGEPDIDARSDVFSLGALLYRCLTGVAPFGAPDLVAVLMKVVVEEPEAMPNLRAEIPASLEALRARMMAKERDRRPRDGAAILAELALLGPRKSELSAAELRVTSLVVFDRGAETEASRPLGPLAQRCGGALSELGQGRGVVAFTDVDGSSDASLRAARFALSAAPFAVVSLVTGTGGARGGESLVDRAVQSLGGHPGRARVDRETAESLAHRFELEQAGAVQSIVRERPPGQPRLLLGRATPLVGRDREVAFLESLAAEAFGEPMAEVAIVEGPAGIGKSRLRHAIVDRIVASEPLAQIWLGYGDMLETGAPFSMVASIATRAIEALGDQHLPFADRLDLRLRRLADRGGWTDAQRERTRAFLGVLLGVPGADLPLVRAARATPALMEEQVRRAFADWCQAECAERPLALLLEDLHWCDASSLRVLDAAIERLARRPFFVLALTRPGLDPALFAGRRVQRIALAPLTASATARLAREVLGDRPDDVARVVELSGGHPLFVEELLRRAGDGDRGELPADLLGMLQARLSALPLPMRRVLRAGAIFGPTFARDGVAALVGDEGDLDALLTRLCEHEVVVPRASSRLGGQREFTFRHALVREAAYSMIVDDDRARGHRRAVEWLRSAGETEPMVLADHSERAGDLALTRSLLRAAAESALMANDLPAAIARAERAIGHGASGHELGVLRWVQAEAHRWIGAMGVARERASEAFALLDPGSDAWVSAGGELALLAQLRLEDQELRAVAGRLAEVVDPTRTDAFYLTTLLRTAGVLYYQGMVDLAEPIAAVVPTAREVGAREPVVAARLHHMLAIRALRADALDVAIDEYRVSVAAWSAGEDRQYAALHGMNVGVVLVMAGCDAEALEAFTGPMREADALGRPYVRAAAELRRCVALRRLGRLSEAHASARAAVDYFASVPENRMLVEARCALASIHLEAGDLAAAEAEARAAVRDDASVRGAHPQALGTLGQVLLARGDGAGALEAARAARAQFDAPGDERGGHMLVYRALVEALRATGRTDEAAAVLSEAVGELGARAGRIADASIRARYLGAVTEHAALARLADAG